MKDERVTASYWERRCLINENCLSAVMDLIENLLPPVGLDDLEAIRKQWARSHDLLEGGLKFQIHKTDTTKNGGNENVG